MGGGWHQEKCLQGCWAVDEHIGINCGLELVWSGVTPFLSEDGDGVLGSEISIEWNSELWQLYKIGAR